MADLTDPRIVFELEMAAQAVVGETDVLTRWSEMAATMQEYHVALRDLMEAELGDTPTTAQTAVYDEQVRKTKEMVRFLEVCGEGYKSSYLGV
jgi:hypothetical protein